MKNHPCKNVNANQMPIVKYKNMKKSLLTSILASIVGFSAVPISHSAVILGWEMSGEGSPAVSSSVAETVDVNLDSSSTYNALTRTGLGASNAGNAFSSNGWNVTNTFNENNKYLSFSLLPKSGYEMTLESLNYVINGSNTAPGKGRWGFRIGTGAFLLQNTFNIPFALPTSPVVWDFDDITTTETVEFRFWAYGAFSINASVPAATGAVRVGSISGNDLVLNGSVTVVPEPSVSSLLLGGLFGLAGLRFLGRKRIN